MNRVVIGFAGTLAIIESTKHTNYSLYRTKFVRETVKTFKRHPTLITLTGLNVLVFGLWQVPQMHSIMSKYFTCSLISKLSRPQFSHYTSWLLSTCSHQNLIHIGCNLMAFHSFAPIFLNTMDTPTFAQFFTGSAFLSSIASMMYKSRTNNFRPSVGLSGVLMGMLSYTALKYPHVKVNLMFIPIPFEIQSGMAAVACLDICGVLFRWLTFDHAAHLGGAIAGFVMYQITTLQNNQKKNKYFI